MLETFGNFLLNESITITDLSRSTGISRQYLYRIKNGLVHPDSMSYGYYFRLSNVLSLDFDSVWLLIRNSFLEASK